MIVKHPHATDRSRHARLKRAAVAALLLAGGDGWAVLADFIFYALFAPACGQMINRIMYMSEAVMEADEAIGRLDEILSQQPMEEPKVQKRPVNDAVTFDHVTFTYPGASRPALEDVSFSLAPKRIMGLIGKNGAGKSTTLKPILNMVSPESGSVKIFQKDFSQYEKECKQRIGVVFGGIDFYPLKKLSDIAAVTQKFYKNWDQEQYQKYIKRFALEESKKFKELSNGMKVKYLLALALSHHAELLILDEPTSGLDPISREELLHIFRQIVKNENCAILFSTHITSDLDKCADDITYIQNGRVLKSADKDTFLRSFEHLKTPEDMGPLTLEEIMLRTERSEWDDDAAV